MAEKVDFHAPGVEVKKSACYFCHQNCGVLAYVKDGECIGIEGDPDHITSQGGLCCRGTTGFEFLDHPARVNHALKRAGAKGENKWVEIPYDQAIEEIAAKLNQIKAESGAEAVATAGGTLRTDDWARRRFMNLFGSPNGFHNALLCWIPTFMIETVVSGWSPFETDLGNSRCLILWGINPGASNMPGMRGYTDLKKKGLKIICVDPRYSETAAHADIWLPLRPGSDTALSLAMLNTIIFEGLYDKKFVKEWCIGFDELKKHIKPYTARWASEKTWLDPELIREAARMYATNTPGNIQWGCTWDQVGKSAGAGAHARAIMRAICGNLDCPGGDLMPGPAMNYITDEEMEANDWLPEEQKAKQIGSNKFKLTSWPGYQMVADTAKATWGKAPTAEWMCEAHGPSVFKAIITGDPYQIRALIVNATNPISCYGDSKMILEAYKRIEFMVTVDYWITPTALYSDYVLPCAGALERPVMHNNYGVTDSLVCSQRAIQPMYDRHTDYTFWRKLGLACGQDPEMWPWETEEEAFYYIISPTGYECDSYDDFVEKYRYYYPPQEFNKYTKRGFCTRSGKVELKSSILERLGYPPLPTYIAPSENEEENPDVASKFPLVLSTGGGFMPFHHSEHFNNMKMRYIKNDPYFTINPEKAAELGIEEGDWCWIETRRGRIKQRANVEPAVDPRVIFCQRGWWRPERGPQGLDPFGCLESNVNVLTSVDDWDCDPIGGSWANRGLLCRVYKVQPGDQIDIEWSIPGSADTPGVSMMPSEQPMAYELVPYVEPEPDFEVPEGLRWDPDTETAWDYDHVLAYDPESGWLYHPESGTYYDLVTRFMYDGEQGCLVDGDGYRYDLETREPLDEIPAAGADPLADLVYDEEGGYYWTPDYSCYYDQESGWLINAETGVYYDPTTRFAYDPETEDLVDEVGNHFPIGYVPEAEVVEEAPMDIPAGLVYDPEGGYYWTEDYTCYYDTETGWLINYETGTYYCPTTRFAYDPEAGDLVDEATGQHYPLDYSPEAEAEAAPVEEVAAAAPATPTVRKAEPVAEAVAEPEPEPSVDASADPLAAVKAAIAKQQPVVLEEDFVRAAKLGAFAPKPGRLEYNAVTGRMLDPVTGKYYDKNTLTEVELTLGQRNRLEAEAKQLAKKAKKANKKAPFKVSEGLYWDEATGSAWDESHELEFVKLVGRLRDAAGNWFAVGSLEPVELSTGQLNALAAEDKKMARAAKKANKKAPFEVPEGLIWDEETQTAWDYDHVLAYDPESGWLYNPETQVFYDVFSRFAYDAEAECLVDEKTGLRYDMERELLPGQIEATEEVAEVVEEVAEVVEEAEEELLPLEILERLEYSKITGRLHDPETDKYYDKYTLDEVELSRGQINRLAAEAKKMAQKAKKANKKAPYRIPEGLIWDAETESAWDYDHELEYVKLIGRLRDAAGNYFAVDTREPVELSRGQINLLEAEVKKAAKAIKKANKKAPYRIPEGLIWDEATGKAWNLDHTLEYSKLTGRLYDSATDSYFAVDTGEPVELSTGQLNRLEAEAKKRAREIKKLNKKAPFEVPEGLIYDPQGGYAWTEDNTCYYDVESGWLINAESGVYYDLVTRFAYDPEGECLVNEADGFHYSLDGYEPLDGGPNPFGEPEPEPEPEVAPVAEAAPAAEVAAAEEAEVFQVQPLGEAAPDAGRLEYNALTGRMLDPETGKYYDKNTLTEVELTLGQRNRLEAGAKAIAKQAKKANKKAPFAVPEGLIWDEETQSAWDYDHKLEYVKSIGRLRDAEGNWFATDSREPVELSTGQRNLLEAEAKAIAKQAKKANKKAPYKVPEGLIWDEATGSAWDYDHELEYVKQVGRLRDAAGNYFAVDTRETVELSTGQLNVLAAEEKAKARAAKKANKKAPFEVPEGLIWDEETQTAWDYDHVLAYDPESGWLYNPETQVFYDVFSRFAYDAEAECLVDEKTGLRYDMERQLLPGQIEATEEVAEVVEEVAEVEEAAEILTDAEGHVMIQPLGEAAPDAGRLQYDEVTGRMVDPETGKYYDKNTCTEVELSRGQINRLEAGAKEIAKKAKKANKKAPFAVPEGLIWDEETQSAWDYDHKLEYVKSIGRLRDAEGNWFATDSREPVELSTGQRNLLEAEAKAIAKQAKKANKKAPYKVPEGLIWDEATGSAWDYDHKLEYVKLVGRLRDAEGNWFATDTREPVELSLGQLNRLEAEEKKRLRAIKKANKKAPFEVPEGLMWDEATQTAWDYDHVLAYDPESGWLYNPETQVFYDVVTRFAYDAEAENLVDEATGKHYDMTTREEIM